MGRIVSTIESIRNVVFEPFVNGRKYRDVTIVVRFGNCTFIRRNANVVLTDHYVSRQSLLACEKFGTSAPLKALVSLGLATPKDARAHTRVIEGREANHARYRAVQRGMELFEEAGFEFTPAQKRKFNRMRKNIDQNDLPTVYRCVEP